MQHSKGITFGTYTIKTKKKVNTEAAEKVAEKALKK